MIPIVSGLLILRPDWLGMEIRMQMKLLIVAIIGAGAAVRAAWGLMKAYERLAAARDELDDGLHAHRKENCNNCGKPW